MHYEVSKLFGTALTAQYRTSVAGLPHIVMYIHTYVCMWQHVVQTTHGVCVKSRLFHVRLEFIHMKGKQVGANKLDCTHVQTGVRRTEESESDSCAQRVYVNQQTHIDSA